MSTYRAECVDASGSYYIGKLTKGKVYCVTPCEVAFTTKPVVAVIGDHGKEEEVFASRFKKVEDPAPYKAVCIDVGTFDGRPQFGLTKGKEYTVMPFMNTVTSVALVRTIDDYGVLSEFKESRFKKVEDTPLSTQVAGSHYLDCPIQPLDYITKNGLNFCEGNVVKYVTRWRKKGGVEDLKKARHYLDVLIAGEVK